MKQDPPIQDSSTYSPADLAWAKEKVQDILFGCELNIRLKHAGLCSKYICEMDEADIARYALLVSQLLEVRI